MHKQRLGVVIAASAGALGSFLPWAHAPIVGSVNGIQGDGKITLALFGITLVFALFGERAAALPLGRRLGVIITAGLAGVIGVHAIFEFSRALQTDDSNPFAKAMMQAAGTDIGLYLVAIAGVVAPLIALAGKKNGGTGT